MKIDEKLLDAYYQGHCTAEERKAVEEWLQLEDYDQYQLEPAAQLEPELWNKISRRISPKSYRLYYWSAAACIALVCTVFSVLRFQQEPSAALHFATIETKKAERAKVTLPDGTIVHLNANSSLRYPDKFGDTRRVELAGEAFFDVVKNPEKPFIIAGKTTETRVLGTSFNLVEREAHRNLTVLTGKVAYQDTRTKQMMTVIPNEQVEITAEGHFEKRKVYAKKYTAWQEGKLLFDNHSLQAITATLENWYGVKIMITDKKLAGRSFTGQFDKPQLGEVLRAIGFALKFNYKQQEGSIVISPE
ncbi:FecR family protein [Pedobacter sp. AW31-3R]|uniref:FecR family protein n=1 Tax=Pedobacter sp. AW31-3R TaxID=3445781 RepID=UPI003FA0175D